MNYLFKAAKERERGLEVENNLKVWALTIWHEIPLDTTSVCLKRYFSI